MKLFEIMDTAFANFDDTVKLYLQKTFNDLGLHYTHNQIFGVIFDGIKGVMQNVMFYIEDAFTEQNVFTAQRKRSIYSLAKLSGYEPYYGASATGTLYCKIKSNSSFLTKASKIYIHNNASIINKNNNVVYTIILPSNYYTIDLSKPLVTHEFKIVQGTFKNSTYIAKGSELETINLSSVGNYDVQYITVTVNGETWTQAFNLYEMQEDEKKYIVSAGYDNTLNIMFGNGVHGKLLEQGQSVNIKYLNHVGNDGNINIYDEYRFEMFTECSTNMGETVNINDFCSFTINNIPSGGNNPDTIDFVKQMIGATSRSGVLASEDNYRLFLKRFSFIGDAFICTEQLNSTIIISAVTNYFINNKSIEEYFTTPVEKFLLNDHQKNLIMTTLQNSNKVLAGINIKFQDPVIRKFAIISFVKLNTFFSQDDIEERIKTALAEYFINLKRKTQFISKAKIIKHILDKIDVIESFDFNFISELGEETFKNGYYDKLYFKHIYNGYTLGTQRVFYENTKTPGLDAYGNIQLDSEMEIPLLRGGFKYYTAKGDADDTPADKNQSIMIQDVQVFFI